MRWVEWWIEPKRQRRTRTQSQWQGSAERERRHSTKSPFYFPRWSIQSTSLDRLEWFSLFFLSFLFWFKNLTDCYRYGRWINQKSSTSSGDRIVSFIFYGSIHDPILIYPIYANDEKRGMAICPELDFNALHPASRTRIFFLPFFFYGGKKRWQSAASVQAFRPIKRIGTLSLQCDVTKLMCNQLHAQLDRIESRQLFQNE